MGYAGGAIRGVSPGLPVHEVWRIGDGLLFSGERQEL